MPRLHLTDIAVRALKPTATSTTYWDDATTGFGIRVGKRRKTWTVMRGESRERITLGHYPEMKLAEAREEARRRLAAKPEAAEPRILFADAQESFIEQNYRDAKPRTKKEAKRLLDKHFAALYRKPLHELTDADIERELDKLADRPSEQLHAYRVLRCFLRWCIRSPRRYIRHSPMDGYEAPGKDVKRSRVLTDMELVKLWNAGEGSLGVMVKLLILWGTRRGETAAIRRDWITDDLLTIPGSHTKNGRDHAIPLLPMARALLDEQPNLGPYFFPGRDPKTHLNDGSWGKMKRELEKTSGVTDWQIRDVRRTFRSTMPRIGVDRATAEVLLNHAPSVLDEIYDRYDRLAEKRAALAEHESWLEQLLIDAEENPSYGSTAH